MHVYMDYGINISINAQLINMEIAAFIDVFFELAFHICFCPLAERAAIVVVLGSL